MYREIVMSKNTNVVLYRVPSRLTGDRSFERYKSFYRMIRHKKRIGFYKPILEKLKDDENFIVVSRTIFHLNYKVKKYNVRIRGLEQPDETVKHQSNYLKDFEGLADCTDKRIDRNHFIFRQNDHSRVQT